jgi:hypothetical protein
MNDILRKKVTKQRNRARKILLTRIGKKNITSAPLTFTVDVTQVVFQERAHQARG